MWECDWDNFRSTHTIINRYVYPTENVIRMTEQEVLNNIRNDLIFGAVEVDLHVPNELKELFQEMPPIFKNVSVTSDDIGDFMRDYLKQSNKVFKETKYLIGSMFANKILLITPLLKWYMNKDLVVTRVHQN